MASNRWLPVVDESGPGGADPYEIRGWDSRAARPGLPPGALARARAIAEALFSREQGPPPKARLDWMQRDLSDFFGHTSLRSRLLFRACVFAVSALAPLLIWRWPGLVRLSLEDRIRALRAAEARPPLSLALLAAKAILSIVYFEHPGASAEIGWDQRCMKDPAPERAVATEAEA